MERGIFRWSWHYCNRCGENSLWGRLVARLFGRCGILRLQSELHNVAAEKQGNGPVDHHANAAAPMRHAQEVIAPPDPPGHESAQAKTINLSHALRVTEGGEGADGFIDERPERFIAQGCGDVLREDF